MGTLWFVLALYFGFQFYEKETNSFPVYLFVFTLLAGLTRYGAWVLILAINCFALLRFNRKSFSLKQLFLFNGAFGIIVLPWFLYNFLVNELLLTRFKATVLIGQGMRQNGLLKINVFEWWINEVYQYDTPIHLILSFPYEYAWHLLLNLKRILVFTTYGFPVFGILSVLILLGLITTLKQSWNPPFQFLIVVTVLYSVPIIASRTVSIYFLPFGIIYGVIGAGELISYTSIGFGKPQPTDFLRMTTVVIFLLGGGSLVYRNYFEFRNLIDTQFKHYWTYSLPVEANLEQLRRLHPNSTNGPSIMTMYTFFPILYQKGFHTVQIPISGSTPGEILCYKNLSPKKEFYYSKLNFPSYRNIQQYVPADYLLVTPFFIRALSRVDEFNIKQFQPYVNRVDWWQSRSTRLYEIRHRRINCGSLD
jgi:hypothetical protein